MEGWFISTKREGMSQVYLCSFVPINQEPLPLPPPTGPAHPKWKYAVVCPLPPSATRVRVYLRRVFRRRRLRCAMRINETTSSPYLPLYTALEARLGHNVITKGAISRWIPVVVGVLIIAFDQMLVVRMVWHGNLPINCLSIILSKFPPLLRSTEKSHLY